MFNLPRTTETHPALSRKGQGKGVVRGLQNVVFSEVRRRKEPK